jgi:hypothetical protein
MPHRTRPVKNERLSARGQDRGPERGLFPRRGSAGGSRLHPGGRSSIMLPRDAMHVRFLPQRNGSVNLPLPTSRSSDPLRWELAAESITVRIRWFGLCVGYVLVNFVGRETNQPVLNGILTLGAVFALLDSWWSVRGQVFLKEWPLLVSSMEAIFIGFLCHFDESVHSPFRFD